MRDLAQEDRWCAWEELQWEGYVCWCSGPDKNGEGEERGWYVD